MCHKSMKESPYSSDPFDEQSVRPDAIAQFRLWYNDAIRAAIPHADAMTLATASPDGKPSARVVLLKEASERGFVFFTNYHSRKGIELTQNPWATLVFYWRELERQVRIEGSIEKVSPEESDRYFRTRPRESQLGAAASDQSSVLSSRKELEERFNDLDAKYKGKEIPRPEHWGGFRLKPIRIEFWKGRPSRLHDRILYERSSQTGWKISRLAP